MKAAVFRSIGSIALERVDEPRIGDPSDAIVRVTASAICGTDLHLVRGTLPGVEPGTILGHEGIGIVEEVGRAVRNVKRGDRVVIPSTIACGTCSYCRAGYSSQCDRANPNGPTAGTAFFGGPKLSGPFHGMQAEWVRVPFASTGLLKLPAAIADEDAILLSDIFPTAYFGAKLAEIRHGDTICVFGCGPVGQLCITSAQLLGAGRVFAVDALPDRLEMAADQGAEPIDFNREDPVEALRELTGGIGVDRAIDAVGVDATCAHQGPAANLAQKRQREFASQLDRIVPDRQLRGDNWHPGDAPSQALDWAVEALAKAGTLSVIGVYPPTANTFPIGKAMNKNLSLNLGNCNHRRYMPELIRLVVSNACHPARIVTRSVTFGDVIGAYEAFDRRQPGWTKVELKLAA